MNAAEENRMGPMPTDTDALPGEPDATLAPGASWDVDLAAAAERERVLAWRVVALLGGLLVLAVGGGAFAIADLSRRLAEKPVPEPHVLFVDGETGTPTLVTRLADMEIPAFEATVRADLADYVIRRERYNYATIQTDYDAVSLWSSPDVGAAYAAMYEGEEGRDDVLGQDIIVEAEIRSVSLEGEDRATIRFRTTARRGGRVIGEEEAVATIGFVYDASARLAAADRLVDPRGLSITAYTVQEEMI